MTATSTPNSFQKACQERLREDLRSTGVEAQFDWTEGDGSFLSAYYHSCFERGRQRIELFIDENAVGFMFAGQWHSFEKWDYSTLEDLLDRVAASLAVCLNADPVKYSRDRENDDQLGKVRFAASVFLILVAAFASSMIWLQEGSVRTWVSGTVAILGVLVLKWMLSSVLHLISLRRKRN